MNVRILTGLTLPLTLPPSLVQPGARASRVVVRSYWTEPVWLPRTRCGCCRSSSTPSPTRWMRAGSSRPGGSITTKCDHTTLWRTFRRVQSRSGPRRVPTPEDCQEKRWKRRGQVTIVFVSCDIRLQPWVHHLREIRPCCPVPA